MNAERLLAHYEKIADAPDAIALLRRFILDLAVRGKLVPQDASDAPIDQKSLSRELDRKQPTGRTGADLGPVTLAEVPVEIPQSWKWSRLFQLCVKDAPIVYGILQPGPDIRPHGVPYIRPSEIENGQIVLSDIRHTTSEIASQYSRASVQSGDLILTIVGTIGAVALVPQELQGGNITQSSCRLRVDPRFIERGFLLQALRSGCVIDQINRMRLGTAVPRLNIAHVRAIAIPLPPLAEQHRIVAKVDELMGLCDRLEAAREARETTRNRLTAASLARLNAPDPETFQADARFVLDALPALTTRPDQVKALRQTILNLAVRGKLVPQDANDEPASELLKRIAPDASDRKSDAEYELPTIWAWALIDDCFAISGGMQKTPARVPKANAFPYLGVGNVYRGRLDLANVKKFELAAGELDRFRLLPQDILVVEGNGSASEIGRCAVWNGEIEDCVHQNHIIRCRPKALELTAYAALYLNSPDGMAEMKRLAITSAGLFSLSVGKIRKIPFPLPPLAEQHRIVAKVDALMALCDRLEASLTANAATRRHLLDALLAEALLPVNEPKFEEAV